MIPIDVKRQSLGLTAAAIACLGLASAAIGAQGKDNTPPPGFIALFNGKDRNKPLPATGPIELQHHGNPIEFKNIYVKELR
jgi:hypothetical protein